MENLAQGKSKPVHMFVVGTGRSGTQSVAKLLSSLPGCCVIHEKEPQLLQEGIDYLTGRMNQKDMVDLLHQTRSVKALGGERLSGESNLRFSFILPALVEAFPNALYIWMIRDGRSTVSSYFHRKLYHPQYRFKEWELHADQLDEMSSKEWSKLNPFARCCWYWAYTNRTIQHEVEKHNINTLRCKIENFDNDLPKIFTFLGLRDKVPKRAPKVDASTRKILWHYWSPDQRAIFKELAGHVMNEHYPGWEEQMRFSISDEINASIHRFIANYSSFVRSSTRPIRIKLGLKKVDNR